MTAGSGGIGIGSLTITLTGLNPPNSGIIGTSIELISSIRSESGSSYIEAINETDSGICVISAAGTIGTTTINDARAYPNSSEAISDFYIDFTVDKEMPVGSSV